MSSKKTGTKRTTHATLICHAAECKNAATCYAKIMAGEKTGFDGFTIPACSEHARAIREAARQICRGKDASVLLVSRCAC